MSTVLFQMSDCDLHGLLVIWVIHLVVVDMDTVLSLSSHCFKLFLCAHVQGTGTCGYTHQLDDPLPYLYSLVCFFVKLIQYKLDKVVCVYIYVCVYQ